MFSRWQLTVIPVLLIPIGCNSTIDMSGPRQTITHSKVARDAIVTYDRKDNPTLSSSVEVKVPVGDSALDRLFPAGTKDITKGELSKAKESVEEVIPEESQEKVQDKLDECGQVLGEGSKCSVVSSI